MAALSPIGVEVAGELRKYRGRNQPLDEFDFDRALVDACELLDIPVPEHVLVEIGGDPDAKDT